MIHKFLSDRRNNVIIDQNSCENSHFSSLHALKIALQSLKIVQIFTVTAYGYLVSLSKFRITKCVQLFDPLPYFTEGVASISKI